MLCSGDILSQTNTNSVYHTVSFTLRSFRIPRYSRITPTNSRQFAWQPSAQVSRILRSPYLSRFLRKQGNTNTPILLVAGHIDLTRTRFRAVMNCNISRDSITLPASKAGNFVELILLLKGRYKAMPVHSVRTYESSRGKAPLILNSSARDKY